MSTRIKEADDKPVTTQLISINDAAKRLGVCRKTIENLLTRKELRRVPVLRRVMIRESEIESFIRKRMRSGGGNNNNAEETTSKSRG